MTRMGGCKREASKYKFQNLISKFELYNIEPPVLKEGCDGETARICREHNSLPPRKYQEQERPDVVYESVVDFLEREEELANLESELKGSSDSSDSEEWENNNNNSDDDNNEVMEKEEEKETNKKTSENTTTTATAAATTKGKESHSPLQAQERHCIYLKVEDDQRCRTIAQKMGLARGPNGYNRSALLAKIPHIAAENIKLREQLSDMQVKVKTMEQLMSLPGSQFTSGVTSLPTNDDMACAAYDEINDKLSSLKKSEEPSWVHLLMKNLTEGEILQIVNTYDGGKLLKKNMRN